MKILINRAEEELEGSKNKKVKGATSKKQKEKTGNLAGKLSQTRKIKEKIDELLLQMDFVEGGAITVLKELLTQFYDKPEDESAKDVVLAEITRILDIAEQAKKAISKS
jgi:predicted transcriptional regulator